MKKNPWDDLRPACKDGKHDFVSEQIINQFGSEWLTCKKCGRWGFKKIEDIPVDRESLRKLINEKPHRIN